MIRGPGMSTFTSLETMPLVPKAPGICVRVCSLPRVLRLRIPLPRPALGAQQLQMCARAWAGGRAWAGPVAMWMEQASGSRLHGLWDPCRRGRLWNIPAPIPEGRDFSLLENSCQDKVAHLAGRTAGAQAGDAHRFLLPPAVSSLWQERTVTPPGWSSAPQTPPPDAHCLASPSCE